MADTIVTVYTESNGTGAAADRQIAGLFFDLHADAEAKATPGLREQYIAWWIEQKREDA